MKIFLEACLILIAYYLLLFLWGQLKRDNSIVDMAWGMGFVIMANYTFFRSGYFHLSGILITLFVTVWGCRLTWHITRRNWHKGEDFRYRQMREKWGRKYAWLKALVQVYLLQMVLLLLIAASFMQANLVDIKPNLYSLGLGMLLWGIGFCFEVISDAQLKRFKENPDNKGKILTSGLYRYSRHPNYFGEATLWWGIWFIAFNSTSLLTIISPLTITLLVRYVSGVPLLEKHYENRLDYQDYAKKTSIFLPRPQRKGGQNAN